MILLQDVSSLQMNEKIWQIVSNVARTAGASQELSERLSSVTCEYLRISKPGGRIHLHSLRGSTG